MADILNLGERDPNYPDVSLKDLGILKLVSVETGYPLEGLLGAYKLESSYGRNTQRKGSKYVGPFQFSKEAGEQFGLITMKPNSDGVPILNDDRMDLKASAYAYVAHVKYNKERYKANIDGNGSMKGNYQLMNEIPEIAFDYMLHQQGGKGMARLQLAKNPDKVGNANWYYQKIRPTLLKNLTSKQQRYFKRNDVGKQEALQHFIKSQITNLGFQWENF